jgi:glycosyltransferase involved in cell wall biosynthesis
MLAIVIKTFLREKVIRKCVKNIFQYIHAPFRLYVVDDSGDISDTQTAFYDDLIDRGHSVIRLPFDSGLSAGRNAGIDALQDEEYVFLTDDDIFVGPDTDISIPINILSKNDEVKLVGGALPNKAERRWHLRLYLGESGILYKVEAPEPGESWKETDGIPWIDCDCVLNFFVAKREIFEQVRWDTHLKMSEHVPFFWRLYHAFPRSVAFTPAFPAQHISVDERPQRGITESEQYRKIYQRNWAEGRWRKFEKFPEVKAMMHGIVDRDRIWWVEKRFREGDESLKHVPWIDWYE